MVSPLRIKIAVSLCLALLVSVILSQFFFIHESPVPNPHAFTDIALAWESVVQTSRGPHQEVEISQAPTPLDTPALSPTLTSTIQSTPSQPTQIPPSIPNTTPPTLFPTFPPPTPTRTPTYSPPPTAAPIPTSPPAPTSSPKVSYADFGKCLNEKGMVMYGTATCGLCIQQKKTLKDAVNYIRIVDCNESEKTGLECSQVGVRGLPTWGKNGTAVLSGPQTNEALGNEAGCPSPT